MPAGWLKPRCRHIFTLMGVLVLGSASIEAQTKSSSVMLTASVSETVALSVLPGSLQRNVAIDGANAGSTVRLILSGAEQESPVIRVPLLARSNSGFKISASFESEAAVLIELSVVAVRPTGALVSPGIINALDVNHRFDRPPLLVLSGPRISLGGTLQSPNNALQITLLIRVKPEPHHAWSGRLTLAATAE